jgi:hypothetical protein
MSIFNPDLTGLLWDYYVTTYQRTIFKYAQKITFDVPVFLNERFKITKLGTSNEVLQLNVHYAAYPEDIHDDAISVCKNMDVNFDKVLLKSITILSFTDEPFKIQVAFNQLFADEINYARINQATDIEVTPTLVSNMVEQIAYLQQMVIDGSENFTSQSSEVRSILDEHPNGDSPDNLILDEIHTVNTMTAGNKSLIHPIYGAFFRDSVIIKNATSDALFQEGLDYAIIDLDLERTRNTSNHSGVFRNIKILKPYVGDVKVTYRAYGGDVDASSIKSLQSRLQTIESFLSKVVYITPSTLPADLTITGIMNKLQELEGKMRLLLQNGLPSYGDVSSGTAVVRKITAQDGGYHWWSIATLYRVDGSVDNVLADVFKFRLKSVISKLMFECDVVANVNANSPKRFHVTCNNSCVANTVFDQYTPKLRLLEVSAGGVYSGVVLQIGMRLGTALQETFDIEDMSGRESCWKLVPFTPNGVPPEDTGVLMPNGSSIFTYGDASCIVDEDLIPFKDGIEIMKPGNTIPLVIGTIAAQGITENAALIVQRLTEIPLTRIKGFLVHGILNIADEANERHIDMYVPLSTVDPELGRYYGTITVRDNVQEYILDVFLKYLPDTDRYAIRFELGAKVTTFTLNVSSVKLLF